MKKSFVLYTDNYEPIKNLSLEEKGRLLDAIFTYASNNELTKLDPVSEMAFTFIKQQLDRDNYRWEETKKKRQIAGSLGGKQRVANQAIATFAKQNKQEEANQGVSVSGNENVTSKNFLEKKPEKVDGISLLIQNGY